MTKKNSQVPMVEVPVNSVQAMAESIRYIADAVKRMTAPGGLTEDAIVTLLNRSSGVSVTDIRAVLKGMRELDKFCAERKKVPDMREFARRKS